MIVWCAAERRWHVVVPLVLSAAAMVALAAFMSSHAGLAFTALMFTVLAWAPGGILSAYPSSYLSGPAAASGWAVVNAVGSLLGGGISLSSNLFVRCFPFFPCGGGYLSAYPSSCLGLCGHQRRRRALSFLCASRVSSLLFCLSFDMFMQRETVHISCSGELKLQCGWEALASLLIRK